MRVLSIGRFKVLAEVQKEAGSVDLFSGVRPSFEPRRYSCVVGLSVSKGLEGQLATQCLRHGSLSFFESCKDLGVVVGIDDDHHTRMVLVRCPHQSRSTDVDHLDDLLIGLGRVASSFLKRVEVVDHQVDRGDRVLAQITGM